MAIVGLFGSRSLSSSSQSLVSRVVSSVSRSGRDVGVGCSVGADALALRSALALGVPVHLFAIGGPGTSGAVSGFWAGSFRSGLAAASSFCSSVRWWAGGPLAVSLRRRLSLRTRALVFAVAASGPGSGWVGFVGGGWRRSVGSWASVRWALLAGLPVVVFPVGCSVSCFPVQFSGVGPVSWVPVSSSGVWAGGFRAVPAQSSFLD